jgi:hypothetical protein
LISFTPVDVLKIAIRCQTLFQIENAFHQPFNFFLVKEIDQLLIEVTNLSEFEVFLAFRAI